MRRSRTATSGPHGASWRHSSGHAGETSAFARVFFFLTFVCSALWRCLYSRRGSSAVSERLPVR